MLVRPDDLLPGLRAIIVRKLVEKYGFSKKRAADVLGLSPAAVTLYLQGKRASEMVRLLSKKRTLHVIDEFVKGVVARDGRLMEPELYELAFDVLDRLQAKRAEAASIEAKTEARELQMLLNSLKARLQAEQESAEEFMRVAAKLKSDVARMTFRIIASDCIRHADTIASLLTVIEKGGKLDIDVPSKEDLLRLLSKEETAHVHSLDDVKQLLPHKIIKILVEAIEDDERKHARILKGLMGCASARS